MYEELRGQELPEGLMQSLVVQGNPYLDEDLSALIEEISNLIEAEIKRRGLA